MISSSPAGQKTTLTPQEIEYYKFLQSGTHERIIYTPSSSAWYNRIGSDDQERIAILAAAHGGLIASTNKMKIESQYAALFHDIKVNEKQWFLDILSNEYNFNLLDGLAVSLGTYASLKRNRSELHEALEILIMAKRILDLYQIRVLTPGLVHGSTSSSLDMILYNMHGLCYKQSGIWVSFLPQLKSAGIPYKNYDSDVAFHYRTVIHWEIKNNKIEDENSCYACALVILLGIKNPTLADLAKLSNQDLLRLFEKVLANAAYTEADRFLNPTLSRQAKLKNCVQCGKLEPTRGAFQCCSKCLVVHYCSRDCQSMDWKAKHKRDCKGK